MGYANFGTSPQPSTVGLQRIYTRTLEGQTTAEVVSLAPGAIYLVASRESTISTGKVYGCRVWLVCTPDAESFGTAAATRLSLGATENAGIATTVPSDSTFTFRCATSAYRVTLAVYRMS